MKGSIEPLVTLNKNGVLANAGAVICEDFDLQSARGSLSKEDLKTLFDVRDGGTVESKRYGTIDFPPGLPRLFSFNSEATIVLSIFGEEPTDAHSRAQLKRVCIAGFGELVTTPLMSDEGKQLAKSALNEGAQDDLNREQAWWENRRTAMAEDMFKGFGAQ